MTTPTNTAMEVYRRFGAGDLDGVIALCADDIEWVVNGPPELEKCREFRGHAGVRQFFAILGRTWEFTSFEAVEYLAQGNSVVVLGRESGLDKSNGVRFRNRWAHVFEIQEGKIKRFREFLCCWFGDSAPPPMTWVPGSNPIHQVNLDESR